MNRIFEEKLTQFKKFCIEDVPLIREYFSRCRLHLSDYSVGFCVMWQSYFSQYWCILSGCLVFAEVFRGRLYFHYPMSLEEDGEDGALQEIENLCRENGIRLHYTSVPQEKVGKLVLRYGTDVKITNPRRWRDYIYNACDFVNFAGKKYSGQRNHINKFKKLYPDYSYCSLTSLDEGEITAFLKEFESRQIEKGTLIAKEELKSVYGILKQIDSLNLIAGGIRAGGKLVAFSVGEVCGDMLIIHVEKALTDYEGVYCTMANEFAKHNVTKNITLINREDDAGDRGLRKSKLQYNPVYLGGKHDVIPHRVIDNLTKLPEVNSERLVIREVTEEFAEDFYRLEYDKERNLYWGYDWRKHYSGEPSAEYFLQCIQGDFAAKEEMPLGIFVDGKLAGEVVLHKFGYRGECEIGVRLLEEYEGKGYAKEALLAMLGYAFYELDLDIVYAKCYKQNIRSFKTLLSAGMKADGEDDVYYYFKKTAAM